MTRARDLGIVVGHGRPGTNNAITDVAGVRVGYATLIDGERVRTGVTMVLPSDGTEGLFAGTYCLNGNGEMTGLAFVHEMGMLASPIGITNTHSVGAVHAGIIAQSIRTGVLTSGFTPWSLPIVAETYDGILSDINGFHIHEEQVAAAFRHARDGRIAEGNVGGGTGMICHGFKGGTGTSSRVLNDEAGRYAVGVLVQANHGRRPRLQINGVPVGREIPAEEVSLPQRGDSGTGSIIVIVATDAPLLSTQCDRLARRAALGIGRTGGLGEDSSGDLILAFATGNRLLPPVTGAEVLPVQIEMLPNAAMNPLFEAVVEATEEAIVNAMVAAETMHGFNGSVAYALPHERLIEVMRH